LCEGREKKRSLKTKQNEREVYEAKKMMEDESENQKHNRTGVNPTKL
jgi:hypothetical protein